MFKTLKAFFEDSLTRPEIESTPFTKLELACAVLLIEVAMADDDFSASERASLEHILQFQFNITPDLITTLINTAEQSYQDSIDHFQFTKHLSENYDYPQRLEFIAALWQLAYADNELDVMEEHRIRRFCDLLFIDHSDFIRLKLIAKNKAAVN
jgi:uncharacterized tellurite resistance protein B-like protein